MSRLVPILAIALLLLLSVCPPAAAQDSIEVVSTAQPSFPQNITFSITASSGSKITDVFLQYRVEKISAIPVTSVIQPDFLAGPIVKTQWVWDMGRMLGNIPPGSEIHYNWKVRNASGETVETGWNVVTFADDRYDWKTLSEGMITVLWYDGDSKFGQDLLDAALSAEGKISTEMGAYLEEPVTIYVYAGVEDFQGSLIFPQDWVGGIAFSDFGTISIGIKPNNLSWGTRAIAHELAHLITYQMTSNPYGDIPSWLNEGISMYAEGNLDPSFTAVLDDSISRDKLFSVQSLAGNFPAGTREALLAYAQSYSLVSFLLEEYGREKMSELLGTFQSGATYDEALLSTYGFDIAGLEKEWRSSIGADAADPSSSSSASPVFTWGLIALGLILTGAVIYFRRQRSHI
ncbi:MAG: peptidase MA domain-containing protein [Dehalococcoidia bacterium]|nr:peptidase MA domain-containing protein [Dehalococcoidia bacterium]